MNKNRNLKCILIVSIVASAIFIGTNLGRIKFSLSLFDIYRHPKVTSTVDTIKKDPSDNPLLKIIEIENPVDNIFVNDNKDLEIPMEIIEDEEVKVFEEVEEVEDVEEVVYPSVVDGTPPADSQINSEDIRSIQDVSKEYNDKFTDLQIEFEDEFNSLIQSAILDYNAGVSNIMIVNIYIDKGYELEIKFEEKFNLLIGEMEIELKENSHDTTLIDEVKLYYETFKSEKKALLMSEAMELVLK